MTSPRRTALDAGFALLAGAAFGLGAFATATAKTFDPRDPRKLDAVLGQLDASVISGALLGLLLAFALRNVVAPRTTAAVLLGLGATAFVARVSTGPTAVLPVVTLALGGGLLAAVAASRLRRGPFLVDDRARARAYHAAWIVPAVVATTIYSIWSITRHESFGSGSWDLGCHVQNTWQIAHGTGFMSTVLPGVNFMGDHFMPVLFLAFPLAYLGGGSVLLFAQAVIVALAAWPLALLARRGGVGPLATTAIVIAYLFHPGTLSMISFDVHEIAPVPFGMLFAVYGFVVGRRAIAYPSLLLVASCKESAILYAGAIGAWLFLTKPGKRVEGLIVGAACVAWFFIVVGKIQPKLLEGGAWGMIHLARFSAFGDSLTSAALNMALHPGKVVLHLVSPAEKLATLQTTFGAYGLLPLAAPDALVLASTNLMERFLADKREMWGLGFHYSLTLVGVAAYASVVAAARVARAAHAVIERLRGAPVDVARPIDAGLAAFVLLSTIGAAALLAPGYELATLHKPYFSKPAQIEINKRAVAFVPDGAAVVAQNHFVPHLARREKIWMPEWKFLPEAEYVVLNPTESPWPKDARFIVDMTRKLLQDPQWTLVFSEGTTVIFRKGGGAPVQPTDDVRRAIGL